MAGGDGGLDLVRPGLPAAEGGVEHGHALFDAGPVPPGAVLVLEGHELAGGVDAGRPAGVVEEHERQQSEGLRFVGHELGQGAGQTDGLGAQARPHQVGAGRGRVALVERQVQHGQHRGRSVRELMGGRHPVGDAGVADLALGPHQPLGHRRLRHQECPGDLGGGETAEGAQGEGDLRLEGEGRVAAGEDQPEAVVDDAALVGTPVVGTASVVVVVGGGPGALVRPDVVRRHRDHPGRGRPRRVVAQPVDGPVAGGGREPGPRTAGDAVARPAFQGPGEGVLGALLGQVPVARRPDEGGDDTTPLLPERSGDRDSRPRPTTCPRWAGSRWCRCGRPGSWPPPRWPRRGPGTRRRSSRRSAPWSRRRARRR